MKRVIFSVALGTAVLWVFPELEAAYTIKDGKLINMTEVSTLSVQEHYSLAKQALETKNWPELIHQAQIVVKNFPETAFAWDCHFYLGEAYFHLHELDFANSQFSLYLKQSAPKFFEKALEYKFAIAQSFEKGEKRPLLGVSGMPKWMTAYQEAIEIYDEVIMALPQHDLAVQSLLGKGILQFKEEDFKESIETFQTLIRRFPKHPLACDSYVYITKVYLTQSQKEYADPDYLDLAEINVKKFKIDFPSHPKVEEVEGMLLEMKELYAGVLYNTAQFYERTKKPSAAMIYYSKILSKYPGTKTAQNSQKRFDELQKKSQKKEEGVSKKRKAPVKEVIVEAEKEVEETEAAR